MTTPDSDVFQKAASRSGAISAKVGVDRPRWATEFVCPLCYGRDARGQEVLAVAEYELDREPDGNTWSARLRLAVKYRRHHPFHRTVIDADGNVFTADDRKHRDLWLTVHDALNSGPIVTTCNNHGRQSGEVIVDPTMVVKACKLAMKGDSRRWPLGRAE